MHQNRGLACYMQLDMTSFMCNNSARLVFFVFCLSSIHWCILCERCCVCYLIIVSSKDTLGMPEDEPVHENTPNDRWYVGEICQPIPDVGV